jgi:hypothetical protein
MMDIMSRKSSNPMAPPSPAMFTWDIRTKFEIVIFQIVLIDLIVIVMTYVKSIIFWIICKYVHATCLVTVSSVLIVELNT